MGQEVKLGHLAEGEAQRAACKDASECRADRLCGETLAQRPLAWSGKSRRSRTSSRVVLALPLQAAQWCRGGCRSRQPSGAWILLRLLSIPRGQKPASCVLQGASAK